MGFWTLLEAASMPILQVLIVSMLGAFMATGYSNLLPADTRRSLNKIVFMVFTPSLMFASLAQTVTLEDIISWWFMPVNIALTFVFGGILGWILVKIMRPKPHLEGLIIATCSSGNLGNLLLIIVPAICDEDGSPFGDSEVCSSNGLAYASFSMALGGFFIWTYTYHLIRTSSAKFKALELEAADHEEEEVTKSTVANQDLEADQQTRLLTDQGQDEDHLNNILVSSAKSVIIEDEATESQAVVVASAQEPAETTSSSIRFWTRVREFLHQIIKEMLAPPTLAAILGFVFGATKWLRYLIIGDSAPLRVIQESIELVGEGTIPCMTLILGGNLTQGLRSSKIKLLVVVGVICVRYVILPGIGIWIVKMAHQLGFLPSDPLFRFVLMVQFTLPPAMNIGTITQLFDVAQDECSILFLWTYLFAALGLTFWSTIYMWILS